MSGETYYQKRRRWQREEAVARRSIRPLRDEVNRLLKQAGLPRAVMGHRRISGVVCRETGYATESEIHLKPNHVVVRFETYTGSLGTPDERHRMEAQKAMEVRAKAVEVIRAAGLSVEESAEFQQPLKVFPRAVA